MSMIYAFNYKYCCITVVFKLYSIYSVYYTLVHPPIQVNRNNDKLLLWLITPRWISQENCGGLSCFLADNRWRIFLKIVSRRWQRNRSGGEIANGFIRRAMGGGAKSLLWVDNKSLSRQPMNNNNNNNNNYYYYCRV